MSCQESYIGCSCDVENLRTLNDRLNAEVVEQVNETQELVHMTNFALETDEFLFKKCSQERISDIASWRWVLSDLIKRLDEAIASLKYEHKALRVVIQRIKEELEGFSRDATRPGVLCPLTDSVEDAISQEYNFLRKQKLRFEHLIPELEKQRVSLEKIKKRIEDDVLKKEQAIIVEEACVNMDLETARRLGCKKKCRKKGSPIYRWEARCMTLKNTGLRALSNAVVTRQQLRGARVQLSVLAQAYAGRVDSALRRRLHANQVKVQELSWQREEAIRDFKSLDEEIKTTEQSLLVNMEKEKLVVARLADRCHRPVGELTKDDVDRKLREELARLRRFIKDLRNNIKRITSLQDHLSAVIAQIDCCGEDIIQVVRIDQERIQSRLGDSPAPLPSDSSSSCVVSDYPISSDSCVASDSTTTSDSQFGPPIASFTNSLTPPSSTTLEVRVAISRSHQSSVNPLETISEENEEDDGYPFKD